MKNFNAILFYNSKKSLYHYTIPFYNTFSIPNFYFPILLIKIIYLHNKIYFFFFSFFPIFSSTFPQPLSPCLHYPVTTTAPPPCPPRHHCPLPTKIPPKQKPILNKKKKKPSPWNPKNPFGFPQLRETQKTHSPPASSSPTFFLVQTQLDLVTSHHTHPWNLENPFLKPTPTNPSTNPNPPPCPDQTTNPT